MLHGEAEVKAFAELILRQINLPQNIEKGGWQNDDPNRLIERGIEEMYEIYDALYQFYANPCEKTKRRVLEECGDAGAFPMMVADIISRVEVRG